MQSSFIGFQSQPPLSLTRRATLPSAPRFGHLHHSHGEHNHGNEADPAKKTKAKKPLALILWGFLDVILMGGSVFMADILVPDDHHSCNHSETAQDNHEGLPPVGSSGGHKETIGRALQISGLATGLHLLSHVGLAGGWFMYGRHRGSKRKDENNTEFEAFQKYAEKLSGEGKNFKVIPLGNGEFKIVETQAPPTKPPAPEPKAPEPPKAD